MAYIGLFYQIQADTVTLKKHPYFLYIYGQMFQSPRPENVK